MQIISIKYPQDRKDKMAVKRLLEHEGARFEHISMLATIDDPKIIQQLKDKGCTIKELTNNIESKETDNKNTANGDWQSGFKELFQFFLWVQQNSKLLLINPKMYNEKLKTLNLPLLDKLDNLLNEV